MKNTEPAFPCHNDRTGPEYGLTKRELMAAIICAGFNANTSFCNDTHHRIAAMSVEQTDALLEQLAK